VAQIVELEGLKRLYLISCCLVTDLTSTSNRPESVR
jgi:hypothetical protein